MSGHREEAVAVMPARPAERASGPAGDGLEPGATGQRQETVVAREIRARSLAEGHPHARVAALIHGECEPVFGTTWIRAFRLALGVALADVVAQIKARYAAEGRTVPRFSETLLSAYESGQKRPGPEYLHYLCVVYQADPQDLGYPDPCFCGQGHGRGPTCPPGGSPHGRSAGAAPAGLGAEPAASGQAGQSDPVPALAPLTRDAASAGHREAEDDDDVLRRTLLRLVAHAEPGVDGRFFGAADRIRRRMDEALARGSVSATMLDQWEETTAGYGRQYMTVPAARLLCDVLLDLGDVRRMSERRQPLEAADRLCRLAGRLAGLAGMIMIDLGDQRLARAFFRTARTAADETGDRRLRSWVAAREALVPLYYGDPREAAELAHAAADLAGRQPTVAGVMAPALEARALARAAGGDDAGARGRVTHARTLLGRAQDMLARLTPEERGDTAFGYTERQFLFHEGDALVTLGHPAAEKALLGALRLYSPAEILDRSLVSLGLARCRLEANQPEEALRLSQDALLAVPRGHRAEIVVRAAWSLGESVAGRHGDCRAVREYREALLSA